MKVASSLIAVLVFVLWVYGVYRLAQMAGDGIVKKKFQKKYGADLALMGLTWQGFRLVGVMSGYAVTMRFQYADSRAGVSIKGWYKPSTSFDYKASRLALKDLQANLPIRAFAEFHPDALELIVPWGWRMPPLSSITRGSQLIVETLLAQGLPPQE